MDARELRIGNYLKYNDGGIFKVTEILEFGLSVEDDIEETYMEYENFTPIELTEDILVRLCNEEYSGLFYPISGRCTIDLENKNCNFYIDSNYSDVDIPMPKYLHLLQNLYWCLCGQELNFIL